MSSHYENEFVNAIDAVGFAVMRAPSSGSATVRDLPDVLAGKAVQTPRRAVYSGGTTYADAIAVEHKSTSDTTAYVSEAKVAALERFSAAFGAESYLVVRYTSQATPTHHFLVRPADARRTDSGNYGLPIADIHERATWVLTTGEEPELISGGSW